MLARRQLSKLIGVAMATAAVGFGSPGIATADTTDDTFMHKLFADGVAFAPKEKAVARAQVVCGLFGEGMSSQNVIAHVVAASAFTIRQAALFTADATQFYCPGHASLA